MLGTSGPAVPSRNTVSLLFSLEILSHVSSRSSNASSVFVKAPPAIPGAFSCVTSGLLWTVTEAMALLWNGLFMGLRAPDDRGQVFSQH